MDGDGNMYIADTGHHRILKVRKGHAEVYAGCGSCGYEGDGSDARAAKLNRPAASLWIFAVMYIPMIMATMSYGALTGGGHRDGGWQRSIRLRRGWR